MNDPYQILGVSRNATDDEIKKAYRSLSRKYHRSRGRKPRKIRTCRQQQTISITGIIRRHSMFLAGSQAAMPDGIT